MKGRTPCVVVVFGTTTDAMAMERAGRRCGLRGRLVPVPRQLSAGCGLAWREPADNEDALRRVIADEGVTCDALVKMEL